MFEEYSIKNITVWVPTKTVTSMAGWETYGQTCGLLG